jgi:hypothetical protein
VALFIIEELSCSVNHEIATGFSAAIKAIVIAVLE